MNKIEKVCHRALRSRALKGKAIIRFILPLSQGDGVLGMQGIS
jgi:hypothetical protein